MSHVTVVTVVLVERYFFLPTFLEKSPDFFRKKSRLFYENLPTFLEKPPEEKIKTSRCVL